MCIYETKWKESVFSDFFLSKEESPEDVGSQENLIENWERISGVDKPQQGQFVCGRVMT